MPLALHHFSRAIAAAQPSCLQLSPPAAAATLHRRTFTARPAQLLNESRDKSPEELEQAKQQQQQDGKAREKLASQSEGNVKADREPVRDHDQHMRDLQKETAKKAEEAKR